MRRRCSRADASWSAGRAADAEIHWPSAGCGPHVGQVWPVEVELTPKPAARIMAGLLARPGYTQVVYLTSPAARAVVTATAGNLPAVSVPTYRRRAPKAGRSSRVRGRVRGAVWL